MASDRFKKIRKALRGGEQPQRSAHVNYDARWGQLALTSERVLFVQSGLFSFNVEEWPLDRIEAVSFKMGMLFGAVGVRTSGGQVSNFVRQHRAAKRPRRFPLSQHRSSQKAWHRAQNRPRTMPRCRRDLSDQGCWRDSLVRIGIR